MHGDLVGGEHPRARGAHSADPPHLRYLNLLHRYEQKQRHIPEAESNIKATLSHLPQIISFSALLTQALKFFNPHLSGGYVNFSQKLMK